MAALCAAPLAAQQGDRGVFDIQRGETALGREEFSVQPGAAGGGRAGRPSRRWPGIPAAARRYRSRRCWSGTPTGRSRRCRFDTRQASGLSKVYGAALQDNLTIRQTTPAAESVREYPRATGIVILDDSVFALYQVVVGEGDTRRRTAPGALSEDGAAGAAHRHRDRRRPTVDLTGW